MVFTIKQLFCIIQFHHLFKTRANLLTNEIDYLIYTKNEAMAEYSTRHGLPSAVSELINILILLPSVLRGLLCVSQ